MNQSPSKQQLDGKDQDKNKNKDKLNKQGKEAEGEDQIPETEEEMQKREKEDDQDLKALKEKLRKLQERQPPKDKDELIDHLMERLEQAEQAILAAEEVITHERQNRKVISKKLKAKNNELRILVEKEKKTLKDKVHDELEITLQQALKEKLLAEQKLEEAESVMKERNSMFEEIDRIHMQLREQYRQSEKISTEQQKVIENLEEELTATKEERDYLQNLSDQRQKTIDKQNADLDEAYGLITKMEESRIVLNKLLGPNGLITERERQKFLKNSGQDNSYDVGPSQGMGNNNGRVPQQNAAKGPPGLQGHPFAYEGSTQIGSAAKLKSLNQFGSNVQVAATLHDDANEDDFWYQAPKNGGDNFGPAGNIGSSGDYQGYVKNTNLPPSAGGLRTNSRKQGGAGQRF